MFDVVFQGSIASGANPDEVKAKIGTLFKVNEEQLARLFSGRRVTIKSGLDEATAAKYKMAIEKAGALCEIVFVSSQPAHASTASQTTTNTQSQLTSNPPGGFDVAPVGAELGDNKPFVPANIKVDHLSTAPVGADLDQLKIEIEPYQLNTDFDVAPVGSDLEEMPRLAAPLVMSEEMENVSIAEVGSDLGEAKPVQVAVINELKVDIAPAGSDLGAIKKEPPPSPPDTSHIKLKSD